MTLVSQVSCSDPNGIAPRAIRIVNATSDSVGIIAISETVSATIDQIIAPTQVADFSGIVVPPRAARELPADRVSGWRGVGGIFVQAWPINSGVARFQQERFLSEAELMRLKGEYLITSPSSSASGRVLKVDVKLALHAHARGAPPRHLSRFAAGKAANVS